MFKWSKLNFRLKLHKTQNVRYGIDFMDSPNNDNQADVIEALNSTSRFLDDLLNIDNPYFTQDNLLQGTRRFGELGGKQ